MWADLHENCGPNQFLLTLICFVFFAWKQLVCQLGHFFNNFVFSSFDWLSYIDCKMNWASLHWIQIDTMMTLSLYLLMQHSWSVGVCRHHCFSILVKAVFLLLLFIFQQQYSSSYLTHTLCSFQLKSCKIIRFLTRSSGHLRILQCVETKLLSDVVVVVGIFKWPLAFIVLPPTLWTLELSPHQHGHSVPGYQSQPAVDGAWPE